GIIRPEYLLLLCLSHFRVLTAQDVSRLTGRPRNSISRAVNRMLTLAYIKRAPDPDDGRQSKLSITPAGRKLQKKIAATMTLKQEEVLAVLSAAERKTLTTLLRKTVAHASTM
ncbi:MAG: MarR family transcriptional regulator, partial [Pseudomonadota bacterium]